MVKVTLRVNSDEWREAIDRYPDRLRAAFVRGLNRAGAIVARDASRRLASPGPSGFNSVFTGTLLRAMSQGWKVDPERLTLRVGPSVATLARDLQSYAYFVEKGRRPGRPPPARALELWVRRKLGAGEDSPRLARAIARRIGQEGTDPAPFLEPAVRSSIPAMREAIQDEMDGEIRLLNSEGRG